MHRALLESGIVSIFPLTLPNFGFDCLVPSSLRAAEKSGLTLEKVEALGLLSKAESIGALTLLTNKGIPTTLFAAGAALLALAPAFVFITPDTDTTSIVLQGAVTAACAAGGAAAIAGSVLIGKLQK